MLIHHCTRTVFIKLYFVNITWKWESTSYARKVWDYRKAQTDIINRAIDHFDYVNLFLGKDINEQVILFKQVILNIYHNFILNKIILCDKRHPHGINDGIKHLIKR